MLTYPWKCTVLHCNHLGNTWKPLVLMTRHFDYCPSASEGDNQSVRSSAPVVSNCFPCGYNVKLYISRGRLAWWLLAFLHSVRVCKLASVTPYQHHHQMLNCAVRLTMLTPCVYTCRLHFLFCVVIYFSPSYLRFLKEAYHLHYWQVSCSHARRRLNIKSVIELLSNKCVCC